MLNAVRIWILLSTLFVASGWILSALHQLNFRGYTAVCVLTIIAGICWWRRTQVRSSNKSAAWFGKFRRRFQRGLPLIFLALVGLTLIGGAWHPPCNYDSASYRIPRVMHWLEAGQWHWIHTGDVRMNIAGCGLEWLFAPMILLTRGDQWLFLFNWFAFLLLPGLIYSVFLRLGVRPRVAWWWMWLLPSGWCFVMQASSTVNDAFAAAYALAAVDLALRAREKNSAGDLWLALLAAALATGVKQTALLVAFPGLIAVLPAVKMLLKKPLPSLAVLGVCLLVSAVPTMIFNWQNTGTWSGVTAKDWGYAELHSPLWGIIGNIFCLTLQNFKPPFFPFANAWNDTRHHFLQTSFGAHFAGFEDFGRLTNGVSETTAGIGLGISLLIVLAFLLARRYRLNPGSTVGFFREDFSRRLLRWTPWLLLLVFMAKVGTCENGRQLAPYYIFLFPSLLILRGHSDMVRRHWWRLTARLVMAFAVVLVIVSPVRPLFPAQTILGRLAETHPQSKLIASICRSYAEPGNFLQERQLLQHSLPPEETVIGYAALAGQAESSLWMPYGRRQVQRVLPEDSPEQLRAAGIHFVLIEDNYLKTANDTLEQWLVRYHGDLIQQWEIHGNRHEPEGYFLVRLQPA